MHLRSGVVWLAFGLAGLSACDAVYQNRTGEFHAGPVDPVNFPPDYLGSGGNRLKSGAGKFVGIKSFANGTAINQYYFSFTATQLTAGGTASSPGVPPMLPVPSGTPRAYVFDPDATEPGCVAPEGYVYDFVRDDLHYDEQGDIFTSLPEFIYPVAAGTAQADANKTAYNTLGQPAWKSTPVVARVPVTSNGEACQAIKSERTLVQSTDVTVPLMDLQAGQQYQVGQTDGTLLARAVVDPGAAVYDSTGKAPSTGVGLQKWGWYGQYLLAYLDGGAIPTTTDSAGNAKMVGQRVYYPVKLQDPADATKTLPGALGKGYDVVQFKRGTPGYSPICEVVTYDTGDATNGIPPLKQADLPKTAEEIEARFGSTFKAPVKGGQLSPAGDKYVYCLQLQ